MSELDRLHEIIDTPTQVSDDFAGRLAMAPEEDVDEETSARIFASESERGEVVPHSELKQRLGL